MGKNNNNGKNNPKGKNYKGEKSVYGDPPSAKKRLKTGTVHEVNYVYDAKDQAVQKSHPAAIIEDFSGPEPFSKEKLNFKSKKKDRGSKSSTADIVVLSTSKYLSGSKKEMPKMPEGAKNLGNKESRYKPQVERIDRNALHDAPYETAIGIAFIPLKVLKKMLEFIFGTGGNGFIDRSANDKGELAAMEKKRAEEKKKKAERVAKRKQNSPKGKGKGKGK